MGSPTDGIRLLLDQGLPRDAAGFLRESGWQCDHLSDLGMSRADDTDIVEFARERNAVIVTLDADFHTFLAVSMAVRPSVIRLRLQGLDGHAVASRIAEVLRRFRQELETGCLITVKVRKTTCHILPTAREESRRVE